MKASSLKPYSDINYNERYEQSYDRTYRRNHGGYEQDHSPHYGQMYDHSHYQDYDGNYDPTDNNRSYGDYGRGGNPILEESYDRRANSSLRHPTSSAIVPSSASRDSAAVLRRPIAIPQIGPGMGVPFARVYSSYLESIGISVSEFMDFIDDLNVAATASPPLQVLNLAGGIIGNVPHHWAVVAGNIMSTSAQLGTAAVSKGRTELYIRSMNEKLFNPRGLKVALASTEAMMVRCQIPPDTPLLAGADTDRKFEERLLSVVSPYTAPITFTVPKPTTQESSLDKWSAKQVDRDIKSMDKKRAKEHEKEEKKNDKKRHEVDKEIAKLEKEISSLEAKAHKRRSSDPGKIDKKLEREISKAEKKRDELEEKLDQPGKKGHKGKEEKKSRKVLWILIENVDCDLNYPWQDSRN